MKKGDRVIWDNEPGNIAKVCYVYPTGKADIKYPGSKYVVNVPVNHLKKV